MYQHELLDSICVLNKVPYLFPLTFSLRYFKKKRYLNASHDQVSAIRQFSDAACEELGIIWPREDSMHDSLNVDDEVI